MNDAEARLTRLEERYTHLQNHVTEQDRVILELSVEIERLRKELARQQGEGTPSRSTAEDMPANERPPHY